MTSLTISSNSAIGTLESGNLIHPMDQTVNPNDEQNTDETSENNSECLPENLEIMMENVSANWSQEKYQKLKHVSIRNQEVFATPDGALGRNDWIKHQIETDGSKPFKIPPRRVPIGLREEVDN